MNPYRTNFFVVPTLLQLNFWNRNKWLFAPTESRIDCNFIINILFIYYEHEYTVCWLASKYRHYFYFLLNLTNNIYFTKQTNINNTKKIFRYKNNLNWTMVLCIHEYLIGFFVSPFYIFLVVMKNWMSLNNVTDMCHVGWSFVTYVKGNVDEPRNFILSKECN